MQLFEAKLTSSTLESSNSSVRMGVVSTDVPLECNIDKILESHTEE